MTPRVTWQDKLQKVAGMQENRGINEVPNLTGPEENENQVVRKRGVSFLPLFNSSANESLLCVGLLTGCKRQTAKAGRVWSCCAVGRQHKAPSMWLLLPWFECLDLSRFQRSKFVRVRHCLFQ